MSADLGFLRDRLKVDKRWRRWWQANLIIAPLLVFFTPTKVVYFYLLELSVWALVESRTASIAADETAIDAATDTPGPEGD